jgi:hypothetical protein
MKWHGAVTAGRVPGRMFAASPGRLAIRLMGFVRPKCDLTSGSAPRLHR